MRMAWLLAGLVLLAVPAQGGIVLLHTESSGGFTPVEVEAPFGQLVPGSTLGANATNASVSIAGSTLTKTTNLLYINNTNATGAHYARLALVGSSDLGALDVVRLGIDNGSTSVDQIIYNLGSITDADGTYVRLEPGSTNTIYVTQSLGSLLSSPSMTFWVYSADDPQESAYVKTRGTMTLT